MIIETIEPIWRGSAAIVAATGPSLTPEVAETCRVAHEAGSHRVVAVQDAHKLMPWADALLGCDSAWWLYHKGCTTFAGERWSTHDDRSNDKLYVAKEFGIRLVAGKSGSGFSLDPAVINYGSNSGFQAINLAILRGATPIVLVGFNMTARSGKRHFFGDHPKPLKNTSKYEQFIPHFVNAAKTLPPDIEIINATPASALKCFRKAPLDEALAVVRQRELEPSC